MKASLYVESPQTLENLGHIFIGHDTKVTSSFKVNRTLSRGKNFFIEIAGIETVEAAEALKGQTIYLSRDMLADPDEDEFYWHDIIGLEVITTDKERLGQITSIFPTGSNDVYVCEGDRGEILLPAIDDVIKEIDTQRGVVIVELLEGLLA